MSRTFDFYEDRDKQPRFIKGGFNIFGLIFGPFWLAFRARTFFSFVFIIIYVLFYLVLLVIAIEVFDKMNIARIPHSLIMILALPYVTLNVLLAIFGSSLVEFFWKKAGYAGPVRIDSALDSINVSSGGDAVLAFLNQTKGDPSLIERLRKEANEQSWRGDKYYIFEGPDLKYEAVKKGWSWPGTFFGPLWLLYRGAGAWGCLTWIIGAVAVFLLAAIFAKTFGMDPNRDGAILLGLGELPVALFFGLFGNTWLRMILEGRRFTANKIVYGVRNPKDALAAFAKSKVRGPSELASTDIDENRSVSAQPKDVWPAKRPPTAKNSGVDEKTLLAENSGIGPNPPLSKHADLEKEDRLELDDERRSRNPRSSNLDCAVDTPATGSTSNPIVTFLSGFLVAGVIATLIYFYLNYSQKDGNTNAMATADSVSVALQELGLSDADLEPSERDDSNAVALQKMDRDLAASRSDIVRLSAQRADLQQQLEISNTRIKKQDTQIATLNEQLTKSLVAQVEELSLYRSEFFGRLRETLGDSSYMRVVGDRFVVQSDMLFASGAATFNTTALDQIRALADTFKEVAATIPPEIDWILRVDGHTDRVPVGASSAFSSNWELSTQRAISVVEVLISQGIPPERLAASGFGEHQQLDPRDDEIAYRRNRRIEFKLTSG